MHGSPNLFGSVVLSPLSVVGCAGVLTTSIRFEWCSHRLSIRFGGNRTTYLFGSDGRDWT